MRLLLFVILFSPYTLTAQPGSLDPGFGVSGKVVIDLNEFDIANKICSDTAGNIYYAGGTGIYNNGFNYNFILGKLNPDGTSDTAFATNGIYSSDFPGYSSSLIVDALLTNDAIYIVGNGYEFGVPDWQGMFISKLNYEGQPDTSFGNNGIYSPPINFPYTASGKLAQTADGKILFSGYYLDTTFTHLEVSFLGRLLPDGSPDTTFGETGVVSWSPVTGLQNPGFASPANRHSDGAGLTDILIFNNHYLLSGYYYVGENYMCFALLFNHNGTLQSNFASNGSLYFDLSPGQNNNIIDAWYKDNLIYLLADVTDISTDQDFKIQTVDTNGILQNLYGYDFGGNTDIPKAGLIDQHGKMIIAGYSRLAIHQTPGYESDFFGIVSLDNSNQYTSNFANQGLFSEGMVVNDESGAITICESTNQTLVTAGFMNGTQAGDYRDIVIMRIFNHLANDISETTDDLSLVVYPNPASEKVMIEFEDNLDGQLFVYDLNGKVVYNEVEKFARHTEIDVRTWTPGIYLVKVKARNKMVSKKLVIRNRG